MARRAQKVRSGRVPPASIVLRLGGAGPTSGTEDDGVAGELEFKVRLREPLMAPGREHG